MLLCATYVSRYKYVKQSTHTGFHLDVDSLCLFNSDSHLALNKENTYIFNQKLRNNIPMS